MLNKKIVSILVQEITPVISKDFLKITTQIDKLASISPLLWTRLENRTNLKSAFMRKLKGGSTASVSRLQSEQGTFIRKSAPLQDKNSNGLAHIINEMKFYIEHQKSGCFTNLLGYGIEVIDEVPYFFIDLADEVMSLSSARKFGLLTKEDFYTKFLNLFSKLWVNEYKPSLILFDSEKAVNYFKENYIDEFEKRIAEASSKPMTYTNSNGQVINVTELMKLEEILLSGKKCKNPIFFVRDFLRTYQEIMKPNYVTRMVHNDLNTGNVCVGNKESFVCIDPQGGEGLQEPIFDLGKQFFGWRGFADIVIGNFEVIFDENKHLDFVIGSLENSCHSDSDYCEVLTSLFHSENGECTVFDELKKLDSNSEMKMEFIGLIFQYLKDMKYRVDDPKVMLGNFLRAAQGVEIFESKWLK